MSSPGLQHPDPLQLLRLLDGEMPQREAHRIRQHLETCWQCRTEADEMAKTIGECIRYRQNVLQLHLPSPPAPWMDIYAAFSRYDAAPGRVSFFQKIQGMFAPGNRWLIPAAAAVALLCAVYLNFRETPSVQAAALLRQAAAAEQSATAAPRRVLIQSRTRRMTRVAGAAIRKAGADEAELSSLFRSAGYGWDDPLSARTFQAWRERLPEKTDTVEEVSSRGKDGWMVRTSTPAGELASASLTLRRFDFRATEGRLEFRNREWVEMTDISDAPSVAPDGAPAAARPREFPAAPAPAPEPAPVSAAGPSQEVQVVAMLHRLGADLGEPVEVRRSGGRIVVGGVGIAAERQEQIRSAIGSLPGVVVEFTEPAAIPGEPPAAAQSLDQPAGAEELRFQQRMERQLGGRAQFEQWSSQVLDVNESAMARAYALRRLAQRFQPGTPLTAGDVRTLHQLGREHAAELLRAAASMEKLLNPVLTSLGRSAAAVQRHTGERAWQPAAEELFQAARRVESLLAAMLDVSPRHASPDLPSQMLTALAQLRESTEQYARLVADN